MPPVMIHDRIPEPWTVEDCVRAITWAKEWFVYEQRRESPQTVFGAFLFDRTVEDFKNATRGAGTLERSLHTMGDVKQAVNVAAATSGVTYGADTYKGVANALAATLVNFASYYRLRTQWYRFRFFGPTADARGITPRERAPGANYYLQVAYEPVARRDVPPDRRYHRPGHMLRHQHQRADGSWTFISRVPFARRDFVGRGSMMRKILRRFAGRGDGIAVVCIRGLPGVGKTTVVAALSTCLLGQYPDAHVYVSAGDEVHPRLPDELLHDALDQLEGERSDRPRHVDGLAARYHAALNGRRCLILVENVTTAEQVALLRPAAGSALVVTSRRIVALPEQSEEDRIVLAPFEFADATAYLCQAVRRLDVPLQGALVRDVSSSVAPDITPLPLQTAADAVAALCGRLPLALHISARYLLQHPDVAPEEFVRIYMDERARLVLRASSAEQVSVDASLSVVYQALSAEEQRVFRALGAFPVTFRRTAAMYVGDDDGAAERGRPHPILSDLVQYGLIEWDAAIERYELHELVRAYARWALSAMNETVEVFARLHAFYFGLGAHHMQAVTSGRSDETLGAWLTVDHEAPTVAAVVDHFLGRADVDALFACADIVEGFFPFLLRRHALAAANWSEVLRARFEPLAQSGYLHPHPPRHETATHLIASSAWGDARRRYLTHTYMSGVAQEQLRGGDAAPALRYYGEALGRAEPMVRANNTLRPLLTTILDRYVQALRRSDRPPDELLEALRQRIAADRHTDPVNGLRLTAALADTYARVGDTAEAFALLARALRMMKVDGEVRWGAAAYLDQLVEVPSAYEFARAYYVQNGAEGAESLLDVYTITCTRSLHGDAALDEVSAFFAQRPRPCAARVPVTVADVLYDGGRTREAVRFLMETLRVVEAVRNSSAIAQTLVARARLNERSGDCVRALQDYERLRLLAVAEPDVVDGTSVEAAVQRLTVSASASTHSAPPARAPRRRSRRK